VVSENSVRTLRRDTPLGYILSNTDPDKFGLQVDVSFFVQQGYDPVEVVTHLSDRIETMHLKDLNVEDYILGGWPSFVDPGEGEVDFRAAAEAAEENGIEWVMIENGHSTAPLTTIKKGLKEVGVATDDSNKPVSVDD
jgi:sugar phosphate isomerase/epimerase